MHGVLVFADAGARHASPLLHVVVGSFKAAVSRQVGCPVWQRSYYEHVVRGEDELNKIR